MIFDLPFKPLALSLTLALVAGGCHSAPAPEAPEQAETAPAPPQRQDVTPQQKELALRQYVDLQRMIALDDRCEWLDPAARSALDGTQSERAAWLVWQGEDMEQAQDEAARAAAGDATACGNEQIRHAVQFGAWQMRVTWALRAHALLSGADRPAWSAGLADVEQHRPALEAAVATLRSRHEPAIQAAQPAAADDAQVMLAVIHCEPAEAGCTASHGDKAWATYAQAWLTQAENYAAALDLVDDKAGRMPGWSDDATP